MAHPDPIDPVLLAIGTCNRRAGIVAVVDSFKRYHPAARVFVCLVDRPTKEMPPLDIPATIFFADELSLPGGRRFLFKYDAFELCCALKPFAMSHILRQQNVNRLLYLDSDILVLNSFLDDLEPAWAKHSVLLTPHLVQLPSGMEAEFQRSLAQHGAYNGGFIAVNKSAETDRFLDCWANLLDAHCTFDPMNSIYVDQRWLDLLTASSAAVGVLRDPGLNVAYWNLHERNLTLDDGQMWRANGEVLKFFHFSGFDRNKLTTKVECNEVAALRLAREYGELLDQANDLGFRNFGYGWDFYSDGKPIKSAHRDLILSDCAEFRDFKDPFSLPSLLAWDEIEKAGALHEPVRLSQRFLEQQTNSPTLWRLRRHPVIGTVWKLWERFINPSLRSNCPPNGRL
jgi:hypothetical protein